MRCDDFWAHVKRSLNECEPWILVQICMRWESPWESMVYNVACHVVISFVQRIKPSISLKYWAASSGVASRTSRTSLGWWSSLTDKFGDEHINQIWFLFDIGWYTCWKIEHFQHVPRSLGSGLNLHVRTLMELFTRPQKTIWYLVLLGILIPSLIPSPSMPKIDEQCTSGNLLQFAIEY